MRQLIPLTHKCGIPKDIDQPTCGGHWVDWHMFGRAGKMWTCADSRCDYSSRPVKLHWVALEPSAQVNRIQIEPTPN